MERHGLSADKSFGQNFLVEPGVLAAVVAAARLEAHHTVLEVGPGLGTLTRELARQAGRVVAVEMDRRLLPVLSETLAGLDNVEVVNEDAMRFDLSTLPEGSVFASNLPYNVATPLIAMALESLRFERIACLVQLEVGERLVARPGEPAYGALSLLVANFADAKIVKVVPPGAFVPPPKVRSAVVALETYPEARRVPELFDLIRASFAHRRKTLKRNLLMAGYEAAHVEAAMKELELDPRARAERLDLRAFDGLLSELGPVPQHDGRARSPS